MPEEDKGHPPRAAPGSNHLPWDVCSIPTRQGSLPEVGGWDGAFVSARGVGGGIEPGSGTSGTARTRPAGSWCAVGKRRSGSAIGARHLRGANATRRRSASDGNEGRPAASHPLTLSVCRWKRLHWTARGHAANPLFRKSFAVARAVMSLRESRVQRLLRIAAKRAARRCGGCATASANTWRARRRRDG